MSNGTNAPLLPMTSLFAKKLIRCGMTVKMKHFLIVILLLMMLILIILILPLKIYNKNNVIETAQVTSLRDDRKNIKDNKVLIKSGFGEWTTFSYRYSLADLLRSLNIELGKEYPEEMIPRIFLTPEAANIKFPPNADKISHSHMKDIPLEEFIEIIGRVSKCISYKIKDNIFYVDVSVFHKTGKCNCLSFESESAQKVYEEKEIRRKEEAYEEKEKSYDATIPSNPPNGK